MVVHFGTGQFAIWDVGNLRNPTSCFTEFSHLNKEETEKWII